MNPCRTCGAACPPTLRRPRLYCSKACRNTAMYARNRVVWLARKAVKTVLVPCIECGQPCKARNEKPRCDPCRASLVCAAQDCDRPRLRRGVKLQSVLCQYHVDQKKVASRISRGITCAADGCDRVPPHGRWCPTHLGRLRFRGSLDKPARQPREWPEPKWPGVTVRSCTHCGRDFIAFSGHQKCCSDVCRKARAFEKERAYRPRTETIAKTCALCGDAFMGYPYKVYCTDRCMTHAARDRRRARERDAYVEDVWRAKVYARDGYTCQLCHKPVRMDKAVPHPKAPTLDHVIPLGPGKHEYANVQLAHFICNSRKSAGDAQLNLNMVGIT